MSPSNNPEDYELFGIEVPEGLPTQNEVSASDDPEDYALFGLEAPTQEVETVVEPDETVEQPIDQQVQQGVVTEEKKGVIPPAQYAPNEFSAWSGYNDNGSIDFNNPKWDGLSESEIEDRITLDLEFQADENNSKRHQFRMQARDRLKGTGDFAKTEEDNIREFLSDTEASEASVADVAPNYLSEDPTTKSEEEVGVVRRLLSSVFDLDQNRRQKEETLRKIESGEVVPPTPLIDLAQNERQKEETLRKVEAGEVTPSTRGDISLRPEAPVDESALVNAYKAAYKSPELTPAQQLTLSQGADTHEALSSDGKFTEVRKVGTQVSDADLQDLVDRANRIYAENPGIDPQEAISKARKEANIEAGITTATLAAGLLTGSAGAQLAWPLYAGLQASINAGLNATETVAKNVNRGDEWNKDLAKNTAIGGLAGLFGGAFGRGGTKGGLTTLAKESDNISAVSNMSKAIKEVDQLKDDLLKFKPKGLNNRTTVISDVEKFNPTLASEIRSVASSANSFNPAAKQGAREAAEKLANSPEYTSTMQRIKEAYSNDIDTLVSQNLAPETAKAITLSNSGGTLKALTPATNQSVLSAAADNITTAGWMGTAQSAAMKGAAKQLDAKLYQGLASAREAIRKEMVNNPGNSYFSRSYDELNGIIKNLNDGKMSTKDLQAMGKLGPQYFDDFNGTYSLIGAKALSPKKVNNIIANSVGTLISAGLGVVSGGVTTAIQLGAASLKVFSNVLRNSNLAREYKVFKSPAFQKALKETGGDPAKIEKLMVNAVKGMTRADRNAAAQLIREMMTEYVNEVENKQ